MRYKYNNPILNYFYYKNHHLAQIHLHNIAPSPQKGAFTPIGIIVTVYLNLPLILGLQRLSSWELRSLLKGPK